MSDLKSPYTHNFPDRASEFRRSLYGTMKSSEIKYELHDSIIYKAEIGPRKEMKLKISLYEIYYPVHPDIEIRFGGIFNFNTCEKFVEELNKEFTSDKEFSWRIETFHLDTKKLSKLNDMYFYLKTEYINGIRIHCSKFSCKEINQ